MPVGETTFQNDVRYDLGSEFSSFDPKKLAMERLIMTTEYGSAQDIERFAAVVNPERLSEQGKDGQTLLHLTAKLPQRIRVVEALVLAGADPKRLNASGKAAVELAIATGDSKVLNYLSSFYQDDLPPLAAILMGRMDLVEKALRSKTLDPNLEFDRRQSRVRPLHLACEIPGVEMFQLIENFGGRISSLMHNPPAEPHMFSSYNRKLAKYPSTLTFALRYRNLSVVAYLLEKKDELQPDEINVGFMGTLRRGREDPLPVIEVFARAGIGPGKPSALLVRRSRWWYLVAFNMEKCAKVYLKDGPLPLWAASFGLADRYVGKPTPDELENSVSGKNLLAMTVIRGHFDSAYRLLELGTKPTIHPLFAAVYTGNLEMVNTLLKYDLNVLEASGQLLRILVKQCPVDSRQSILQVLIGAGVDIDQATASVKMKLKLIHY